MSLLAAQENFIEDRNLRDDFISRVDVLQRFGDIDYLTNQDDSTILCVAQYYCVGVEVIQKVIQRHRDELSSDGLRVESRSGFSKIFVKDITSITKYMANKTRAITLIPKRAILRIGMLLRDSEVAKRVRTYLLNVEEQSTPEQKQTAVENTEWEGLDILLYDCIVQTVMNENGTLNQSCIIASSKIGKTPNQCKHRFNKHIRPNITNDILIHKIEHNRRGFETWKKNKELKQNCANVIPISNTIDIPFETQQQNSNHIEAPEDDDRLELPDIPGCHKTSKEELMLNFVLGGFDRLMAFVDSLNNDKIKLLEDKIAFLEAQSERYRQTAINAQFQVNRLEQINLS